jgi:ABC-type nitrate/sulfonate/bicarbonate transport system substrate-binding protein
MRDLLLSFVSILPLRRLVALAGVTGLVLASACGGGGGDSDTVTVQLDWTPNTNHTGIYVALANGWYKDAGLKVNILPYTDVNPDVVVANGKADIGISFPPNVVFSRAQGLDLVSDAAVLQRSVTEVAVLDSSDLKRPKDLDGKLYAGFGLPYEEPVLKTMIQQDGGKGTFQTATLSTAAYEALYAKRADFTEIFTTWEGIEADIRGIKLRTFKPEAFGVPDHPEVILIASNKNLAKNKAKLQKFLDVTRRGYEFAAKSPEEAAKVFTGYLPKETFPEADLVRRSAVMMAPMLLGKDGRWGTQDAANFNAYSKWLVGSGVVTDSKNQPLKRELPGGALFTNELLEGK